MECKYCNKSFINKQKLASHESNSACNPNKTIYCAHCKFCGRNCSHLNGLRSHEITCINNPNRVKGKRGDGWYKVDKTAFSKKLSERYRSHETNKLISATCLAKAKSGNWHHGAGKSKKYTYKGYKFDSTWEVQLAIYWDSKEINWIRNSETFPYFWNKKNRSYTPDFLLPNSNTYIEVKGYKTERDIAKWSSFPGRLQIFDERILKDMGVLKISTSVAQR